MTWVLAGGLFPALMVVAGTGDTLSRRIPNWLPLLMVLLFIPAAWSAKMSWALIGIHAATAAGVLIIGFGLFAAGYLGGGDAKLLGAGALWFGLPGLFSFLSAAVLAGGLVALAVMGVTMVTMHAEIAGGSLFKRLQWMKPSVPYGYAIAAGALVAWPESFWARSVAF